MSKTRIDQRQGANLLKTLDAMTGDFANGYTVQDLADKTGFKPHTIKKHLALLQSVSHAEIIPETGRHRISESFARAMVQAARARGIAI